jgi:uncharacterized C2H2 Zn-finger protein
MSQTKPRKPAKTFLRQWTIQNDELLRARWELLRALIESRESRTVAYLEFRYLAAAPLPLAFSEAAAALNWAVHHCLAKVVTMGVFTVVMERVEIAPHQDRPGESRVCRCGKIFTPNKEFQKHCNSACQQAFNYRKHHPKSATKNPAKGKKVSSDARA